MKIGELLHAFDYYLTGFPAAFPWFVGLLLFTGIFMTLRLGFIQLRQFGHAVRVVMGDYDDPEDEGDVTHFQALTVALSATVGVGNIAGVALAIHYGGPGAVFWMWVTAFFGMALKYAECTLAIAYRTFDVNGEASGGPMYYIEQGLGSKPAAVFFAVCAVICSFATGNMNQSNTIASLFSGTDLTASMIGAGTVVFVGAVILGGVKRIASVTEKLAPTMAAVYFAGALAIVLTHLGQVPATFVSILKGAWAPESAYGGTAAGVFVFTLLHGVRRGLFSNEAGQGSAAIAHASARTDEPVREGVVAMTGPFIDTLVICSLTAFAILLTGSWNEHVEQVYGPGDVAVVRAVERGTFLAVEGDGKVRVEAGRLTGARFAKNHATVEDAAVFLVNEDGTPGPAFSGELTVDDSHHLVGAPAALRVRGKGLLTGAPLTAHAFRKGLASIFPQGDWIVRVSVLLFALSTIISWSYYGDRSFAYLFGAKHVIIYRLVYLAFVYLGAVAALELVWHFGDIALSMMAIPNLLAILALQKRVVADTEDYFSREHVPYAQQKK